jgi:Tfp pilus assembly protein PilV
VKLALSIAAGILIASLVMFLGRLALISLAANTIADSTTEALQALEATNQKRAAEIRRQQYARDLATRNQKLQEIAQQRATAAISAAKERAWAAYFSPAATCTNPPNWKAQLECGNQYMRAKAKFEAQWSASH